MMFQVGEFGQLASNDGIRATEHRVHSRGSLQLGYWNDESYKRYIVEKK